jgi:predicted metalloprotease
MQLRTIAICLAASVALVAAGCGDDDDDTTDTGASTQQEQPASAEGGTLKDVEPRTSKPNIVGGNAPIDQFITTYANDAISYWEAVFQNSQLPYRKPTAKVLMQAGDDGCGGQFDPVQRPLFFCASQQGSTLTYGGPFLDNVRNTTGDAAVAFVAGFGIAEDTNDQLSGNPVSSGQTPDQTFFQVAGCFTGAWIKNLADKSLLEAGDDQEILNLAVQAVPGATADVSKQIVLIGYNEGPAACQEKVGGGGGGGGGGETTPTPTPAPETTPQPAPSPSG